MKPSLPENEAERLNALRRYQILDTPPEPAFDRIAEMAANFFQVPMAGVSLVDEDRVWFKSRVGINVPQTARDAGLCSSAMLSQGVYHLSDAAHDQRALGHSFVAELASTSMRPLPCAITRASILEPCGSSIRNHVSWHQAKQNAPGVGRARHESDGTAALRRKGRPAGTR